MTIPLVTVVEEELGLTELTLPTIRKVSDEQGARAQRQQDSEVYETRCGTLPPWWSENVSEIVRDCCTYRHHPVDIEYKRCLAEVYSHVFSRFLHPDRRKELWSVLDLAEGGT
jgi:hypothetical protein